MSKLELSIKEIEDFSEYQNEMFSVFAKFSAKYTESEKKFQDFYSKIMKDRGLNPSDVYLIAQEDGKVLLKKKDDPLNPSLNGSPIVK